MLKFYSIVVTMKSGRQHVGISKPYKTAEVEYFRKVFNFIDKHTSYNITTADGGETYFLVDSMESISIKITEEDNND